jgi:hypothetical protein
MTLSQKVTKAVTRPFDFAQDKPQPAPELLVVPGFRLSPE